MAELASRLDWTAWAGVGVVGILVFLVGIYQPALSGVRYGGWVGDGLAVVGGVVAVVGTTYALDRRKAAAKRPRRLRNAESADRSIAPSLEVYDPRIAQDAGPEPIVVRPPP